MDTSLSKFDTLFLNTDSATVSMHIGIPMLLDAPIDCARYVAWLEPRVAAVPRLRQRIRRHALQWRYPEWLLCDTFDIEDHVHEVELMGDLWDTYSDLYARRLDYDRPPWMIYLVQDSNAKVSAIFIVIHHCMGDARSIFEFLNVFYDPKPIGESSVQAHPTKMELSELSPLRFFRTATSQHGRACMRIMFRYLRSRSCWFPFNRPPSGRVRFAPLRFPLDEAHEMSSTLGGTVTDVVLTVLGGALDRYASDHGIETKKTFLRLQVPANMRERRTFGKYGNALGMLPVLVPLGIANPVERFEEISANSRAMKTNRMAEFMLELVSLGLAMATPPGQALLAKLFVSKPFLRASKLFGLPPREHMLMTSIVMPRVVYEADDVAVEAMQAAVPCQFNMGLICSALAYRDSLNWLLVGDSESLPDLGRLAQHVEEAWNELRGAARL